MYHHSSSYMYLYLLVALLPLPPLLQPEKLPSSVPPHPVPTPHPAQQPLTVPTPSHPFVINYTQAGQQRQRQVLRAKVTEAAHRADEATISRITG